MCHMPHFLNYRPKNSENPMIQATKNEKIKGISLLKNLWNGSHLAVKLL